MQHMVLPNIDSQPLVQPSFPLQADYMRDERFDTDPPRSSCASPSSTWILIDPVDRSADARRASSAFSSGYLCVTKGFKSSTPWESSRIAEGHE
jgi:hypothetical protein